MLPFADVRVIAIEQFGAGPWGTMQLADLGAEIIKIEDVSVGGDVGRHVPPFAADGTSLFFETFNRNKRSVSLDLRNPSGREIFEMLVRNSDAVFSNLRGDGPPKLGICYEDLAEINPRIVCVSLSGFGSTGPRAAEGAYDVTIQALAGWMSVTGGPGEPPTKSGLSLVDFSGGYVAALALIAGVWQARREGVGRGIDLSLFETALALLTYMATWTASRGWEAQRLNASSHQTIVPFQVFPSADGSLVVACAKDTLWRSLCEALERRELVDDPRFVDFAARDRNRENLVQILEQTFSQRTTADWIALLGNHGVPCAPVNDIEAALRDVQTEARHAIVSYDHPALGAVSMLQSPLGATLTRTPERGPMLGEQTAEVLARVCGYSHAELERLASDGAFGAASLGDVVS
jgi:crotonobetainyl-CoA:carnitine CoA-transferase CaiB-like acyl-CoA transferase